MDWEGQEEKREAAPASTVRRSVTIDVSDKVHLEASLAKPKLPPPNKNHTSSSSSAADEAGREGGEGREAYYYHSNSNSAEARRIRNAKVGIVITHPHPMLGGNMHNNVVVSLFKRFAQEGFCVVRFNFRGTGRSTGSKTWRGSGEREDVVAVCRYLQSECGVEAVYLVGYSYGSAIGCSVVNDVDIIKGCIAVSYPFGVLTWILMGHLLNLAKTEKPCLWVIGTEDNFTSVSRFRQSVKPLALMGLAEEEDFTKRKKAEEQSLGESNPYTAEYFRDRTQTTVVVRGMDHFWFDDEDVLADICVAWVQARLADLEAAREQPLESDDAAEHHHHHHHHQQPQQRQRHQPNGQKKDDLSEESHSRL